MTQRASQRVFREAENSKHRGKIINVSLASFANTCIGSSASLIVIFTTADIPMTQIIKLNVGNLSGISTKCFYDVFMNNIGHKGVLM